MRKITILLFTCLLSSLAYGQKVLIPYHANNLWGLADTSGKIVIAPQFSEIRRTDEYSEGNKTDNLFIVKKNGKYGMLRDDKPVMPVKYSLKLLADSSFIKEYGNDRKLILHNIKGELLIKDTVTYLQGIRTKNTRNDRIYVMAANGKMAMFWYNPQTQVIQQWIAKDLYYINVYPDGNSSNLFIGKSKGQPALKYDLAFNAQTNTYSLSVAPGNIREREIKADKGDGGYDSGDTYARNSGPSRNSKNDFMIKLLFFAVKNNKIVRLTTARRYKDLIQRRPDTLRINLDYDNAEAGSYLSSKIIARSFNRDWERVDTIFSYENFIRYTKHGMYGAVAANKIIPAVYNSIDYFSNGERKPLFLVSRYSKAASGIKWGVIDADGKEILPCIYDAITRDRLGDFWLLKKDGKSGLANYAGKMEFEPKYDITQDDRSSDYLVSDNGKYGYINPYAKCYPVLPFKVNGFKFVGKYVIFQVVAGDGRPLGYADKKGFLYFK